MALSMNHLLAFTIIVFNVVMGIALMLGGSLIIKRKASGLWVGLAGMLIGLINLVIGVGNLIDHVS